MATSLAGMLPADRTEMQKLVLGHDWAATPLGPERGWSPTLRHVVALTLNTRFPMLVMWGPGMVMVYNDGYAEMLGDRHPGALGAEMGTVWADVWPVIGPLLEHVWASGDPTHSEDLALTMGRSGFPEETAFTFSYSPVHDEDGAVVGLIDIAVETTSRVLAEGRLRLLQRLGGLPRAQHHSALAACAAALDVLGEGRADVPSAAAYLVGVDGELRLAAAHGVADRGVLTAPAALEHVRTVVATGDQRTVTGEDGATAVLLPLVPAGQEEPVGAISLGVSPHLRLDDEYRTFLSLAATHVAAAVSDARAVETERRRADELAGLERARTRFYADVAVTLQRSFLGPTALPDGFAVHYEPATEALEVGGDWYDVVALPHGSTGVVVGDVVGRGLGAAAVMGQLRSAARALLLEDRSPAEVLSALDRFADLVPGASCSTVCCAVLDPAARTLRYSSAGHPPAVLAPASGDARLLQGGRGLPLAVRPDAFRSVADEDLPAGSTLLLYTDGLVERRGEVLDEGIDRAVRTLAAVRHLPAADVAAALTEQLLGSDRDDDVALLVYSSPA